MGTGMSDSIDASVLAAQERLFAEAFAAGDIGRARELYCDDVVYLSPTVRLYAWPTRIEGIDRTLEFIQLTLSQCGQIQYEAVEQAVLPDGVSSFVRVHFDFYVGETDVSKTRLRSNYVVLYRYRGDRIAQQELYYDPSAPLESIGVASPSGRSC